MTPEARIEKACVNEANKLGWRNIKLDTAVNGRSAPDRLFILPRGRCLFVEFKTPWTNLEPGQKDWRDWLSANGHGHFTVKSVEEFKALAGGIR